MPKREVTEDGFERQVGVAYLSHFALTIRLLGRLCAAPAGGRSSTSPAWRTVLGLEDFRATGS